MGFSLYFSAGFVRFVSDVVVAACSAFECLKLVVLLLYSVAV
jgi:hypothetical protein